MIDGNHACGEIADLGERARFLGGDDILLLCLGDPIVVVVAAHLALANGAFELLVGFLGGDDLQQRVLEQANAILRIVGDEDVAGEAVAQLAGLKRRPHDRLAVLVGGGIAREAVREHQRSHHEADPTNREIVERAGKSLVETVEAILGAIINELLVGARATVILVALEDAGQEIKLGKRVGHAAGDLLLHLEPAAKQRHGRVSDKGKRAGSAGELLPPAPRRAGIWRGAGDGAEREIVEQRAEDVRQRERHMAVESALEVGHALVLIAILQRLDLGEEIGVTAQRALGEGDQRAGQDIGALNRDADRDHLIGALDVVRRPVANAAAAVNVERVVDALPHAVGRNIFEQRRDDRGLLAGGDHGGGHGARGLEPVGRFDHARQRLFHALHVADRQIELLADAGVGRGVAEQRFGGGGACGRKRDGAPRCEAAHQHAPALPCPLLAADDPVDRHEHVLAGGRAVGKSRAAWQMPPPDLDAWMIGGDERERDADVIAAAEMVLRIEQTEGEAEQRRVRRQGNIALVPGELDAERLLAVMPAFGHHADIAHRGCVGA